MGNGGSVGLKRSPALTHREQPATNFSNLREAPGEAVKMNRDNARRAAGQDFKEVIIQT